MAGQDCCASAQEIHDSLRSEGRSVGIASVYRVLEVLSELRLVQRVDVGDGIARFEPALPDGDHHHHVVCDDCGKVEPFSDPVARDRDRACLDSGSATASTRTRSCCAASAATAATDTGR